MNLKEVYEIFYPGKCGKLPSVWKVPPKYRSKKEFFEELLPIEIRWLNYKIWNDKARRSRFLSDCKKEARYIAELRTYLFEHPWTISRIEGITAEDIGIIDVQDTVSYVDILNGKGNKVIEALKNSTIKGKKLKVEKARK